MSDEQAAQHIRSEVERIIEKGLLPRVPRKVERAMLGLVLAWARLDGAMSMATTAFDGLNSYEGAARYGRRNIPAKFEAMAKILKRDGNLADAARIDRLSKQYEERAVARNLIAHSMFVGVEQGSDGRQVFMKYEQGEAAGNLRAVLLGLSDIARSTQWADGWSAFWVDFAHRRGIFE